MDAFCSQYVQNKKIKTVFIFERAPLNLERAIKEREREGKGFFGGRPIGRPETNSGSGQLRNLKYLASSRQPTGLSGPGDLAM
jgi:hypothetical protein